MANTGITFIASGFPVGDRILSHPSGLAPKTSQLTLGEQRASWPLNLCWFGRGMEAVQGFGSWLQAAGRQAGRNFLTLDLLLSLVYGGALAASLWWVWLAVGRPFHPAWIVAPLAMILTADWTENLIQLAQLRHYVPSNEGRIQNFWIQVSSCATIIKLWLTLGLYVSLAGFVLRLIVSFSNRRLVAATAE